MSDEPNTTNTETTGSADLPSVTMGDSPTPTAEPQREIKRRGVEAGGYFWGTGRRKTSVARVRIRPGSGKFLVNKKEVDTYFCADRLRADAISPLIATKNVGKFDVFVSVFGGGTTGQAGAVMLGLARALMTANTEFEPALRDGGYLTRDDRKVERKKPGQPGARKRFQFSKR